MKYFIVKTTYFMAIRDAVFCSQFMCVLVIYIKLNKYPIKDYINNKTRQSDLLK